jgi:hypothetical protein
MSSKKGSCYQQTPFTLRIKIPKRMNTKLIKEIQNPNGLICNLTDMQYDKQWHDALNVGSFSYAQGVSDAVEAIKDHISLNGLDHMTDANIEYYRHTQELEAMNREEVEREYRLEERVNRAELEIEFETLSWRLN